MRHEGVEPIFSETPSLETLRVPLSVAYQEDVFRVEDPFLISIEGMSRAHFYADAVRGVHVRLPDEDPKAKQPGVCNELRKTMYGSLDAAQRWGEHHAHALEANRIFPTRGFSVSLTFWCTVTIFSDVRSEKHALNLLRGACESSKVVTLDPESSQSRTVSFLGRTLTFRQW